MDDKKQPEPTKANEGDVPKKKQPEPKKPTNKKMRAEEYMKNIDQPMFVRAELLKQLKDKIGNTATEKEYEAGVKEFMNRSVK